MVRFKRFVALVSLALTAGAGDGNEVGSVPVRHKAPHSQYVG